MCIRDSICIITPDNVCFAGDALMTEDVLAEAMVPFVFDMADDLATKKLLKDQPYDAWIFCHSGVRYGAVRDLAQKNIDHIQNQLAACAALVREPMTCLLYASFSDKPWRPPAEGGRGKGSNSRYDNLFIPWDRGTHSHRPHRLRV